MRQRASVTPFWELLKGIRVSNQGHLGTKWLELQFTLRLALVKGLNSPYGAVKYLKKQKQKQKTSIQDSFIKK